MINTPIDRQHRFESLFDLDIDLYFKRDDLYPMPGGGIKARKMQYIMDEVLKKGYDVLVTNGGPQSNHARAAALMAASIGMKCHLVIVLEPKIKYPISGNILLMKMAGAKIEYCLKDQLSERMDMAINHYKHLGHKPAYIWGGGHCHAGTVAFVDAAVETKSQCRDWIPDYLVIASGTGTTQAGLAIGYADLPTQVIGISVARDFERGGRIVQDAVNDYFKEVCTSNNGIKVDFRDNWTCGGYEKTNDELLKMVRKAAAAGLIVDPTYSGKGLYGLIDLVKNGDIPQGSKVLFWHSGGLMNLMASQFATNFVQIDE
jgi:1-aminocyclopropane-1-carboxylate deaminase/D-cysteine desulfhydrase-like pyridoxal-dependent ACC family enzyme